MYRKTAIVTGLLLGFFSSLAQTKIEYAEKTDTNTDYLVVLMGGQSNMVGQGKLSDLPSIKFDRISYVNFEMSPDLTVQNKTFGPEIGISRVLQKEFPDKNFILIKYAIGGASMLDWSPDYSPEKAKITGHPEFGNMYDSLLCKVSDITNGLKTKILALVWMQGERDARIPEAGNNYYTNFERFISVIRKDLKTPGLPVFFGEINPPETKYEALDAVRQAQKKISRDIKNTYLTETDDLEKWSDNLHYSSKGQLKLGEKFGNQLMKIIDN